MKKIFFIGLAIWCMITKFGRGEVATNKSLRMGRNIAQQVSLAGDVVATFRNDDEDEDEENEIDTILDRSLQAITDEPSTKPSTYPTVPPSDIPSNVPSAKPSTAKPTALASERPSYKIPNDNVSSNFGIFRPQDEYPQFPTYQFYPPNPMNKIQIDYEPTIPHQDRSKYSLLRIKLDWSNLQAKFGGDMNFIDRVTVLQSRLVLNAAVKWAEKLLVLPARNTFLIPASVECSPDVLIPNDHQNIGIANADLVVYVSGKLCDRTNTPFEYVKGGTCAYDQYNRPIAGYLVICMNHLSDSPVASLKEETVMTYAIAHEFGHILGFDVELFPYYYDVAEGGPVGGSVKQATCTNGSTKELMVPYFLRPNQMANGLLYYEVRRATVVRIARNHFQCENISGVRLATNPDKCLADSYWDPRIIKDDIMSPFYPQELEDKYSREFPQIKISAFTLGLLEDSFWYLADFTKVDSLSFGLFSGCGFVDDLCIKNGELPSYSKGYFCNTPLKFDVNNEIDLRDQQFGCDSTHRKKMACDLVDYSQPPVSKPNPPEYLQYFPNPSLGPNFRADADFCPLPTIAVSINCLDSNQEIDFSFDIYSPNSYCFETSGRQSVCLQGTCDAATQKVSGVLNTLGTPFTCDYDDQEIQFGNAGFSIKCPRATSVCPQLFCPAGCSGRGKCIKSEGLAVCDCFDPNDETVGCYGSSVFRSQEPSHSPTARPTTHPSIHPSDKPSSKPSKTPTLAPKVAPSRRPSSTPSISPSVIPSSQPSITPSEQACTFTKSFKYMYCHGVKSKNPDYKLYKYKYKYENKYGKYNSGKFSKKSNNGNNNGKYSKKYKKYEKYNNSTFYNYKYTQGRRSLDGENVFVTAASIRSTFQIGFVSIMFTTWVHLFFA